MTQKLLYLCFFLLSPFLVWGQQKTITGKVTDNEGIPLMGVVIQIDGNKSKGEVSDIDGNYSIKISEKDNKLKFTYLGMKQEIITIGKQNVINVRMKENNVQLKEMVVIGFGAVRKKELTGAVAQVKSDDIANIVSSDLGTALQGKVSGVNIVASSGAPGSGSEILIRGVSSINGSNQPLYVVDGIPQAGDPRINSNEIETIDILKDAASCAIYGTRGAAGVILITTKQGKAGQMRISADASYGIKHITSAIHLMNTREQGYFDLVRYRNSDNSKDDMMPIEMNKNKYLLQNDTDLLKHAIRDNAATQNYSLNISGGNTNISYNIVGGYYDETGVLINSGFKRFNTRANLGFVNNKWRINAGFGLKYEDQQIASGNIITYSLLYQPYRDDIKPGEVEDVSTPNDESLTRTNWIIDSFNTRQDNKNTIGFANINLNYDFLKELSWSMHLGTNMNNGYGTGFKPLRRIFDVNKGTELTTPQDSYAQRTSSRNTSFSFDTNVNYKQTFNNHTVGIMAAFSLEKYSYDGFLAKRFGVSNKQIESLNGATGDQIATSYNAFETSLVGMIARVQYDWKGRYLLSANIRRDGSSKFALSNRWGTFPSISAAWNVSDEKFWSPLESIISNMKLRCSYGTTGNQSFSDYTYAATIRQGFDYVFGSDSSKSQYYGSAQYGYANADVKWETSVQSNLGVDLFFLNNKLNLTFEYYNTSKKDMLFPVTLPFSSGTSEKVILNVGNMTNKGVELSLGYHEKFGKVNVGISGTFSTNKNRVSGFDSLSGIVLASDGVLIWDANAQSQCTGIAEGYPAGSFFLYKTNGIVDTNAKLAEYQRIQPSAMMGDLIYVDLNNDGQITEADRSYCGSGLPDYEAGLNINLDWKGLDFGMNWYSALGFELINGPKAMAYAYGRSKDLVYAWSPQNPYTSIPAFRGDIKAHPNFHADTDRFLENGSYLRLKAITLGYTLPKKLTDKMKISKLRFYVSAQNPLTITGYQGYDPEIGGAITSRGLDRGTYPVSSFYMAGLNLNF